MAIHPCTAPEIGFVLSHFRGLLLILKDLLALFLKFFVHNLRQDESVVEAGFGRAMHTDAVPADRPSAATVGEGCKHTNI
jgi:hypothetical protein